MPAELRVVLGVSGAFILLFVFIAGQVGEAAATGGQDLLLSAMEFALGQPAHGAGYRLERLRRVGSTNAEALRAARPAMPGGLWVVARAADRRPRPPRAAWATAAATSRQASLAVVDRPGAAGDARLRRRPAAR